MCAAIAGPRERAGFIEAPETEMPIMPAAAIVAATAIGAVGPRSRCRAATLNATTTSNVVSNASIARLCLAVPWG